nr:hypothetical protein I308_03779 [Cryptococcus tetragattii IND107]
MPQFPSSFSTCLLSSDLTNPQNFNYLTAHHPQDPFLPVSRRAYGYRTRKERRRD